MPQRDTLARSWLIAGLVLVFGAFGIDKFLRPIIWIGWMPAWMNGLMGLSADQWLQIVGGIEIFLAAALLFPVRKIRQAATIFMILHLIAVLTQTGLNDVGIRDAGLLLSAVALWFLL